MVEFFIYHIKPAAIKLSDQFQFVEQLKFLG